MLLRILLGLACEELGQAQQVVGGAAEDEDPVDLGQASQLHPGERAGLLQPAEGLLDQPAAAELECIAGCRVVLRSMFERRPLSLFCTCAVTLRARAPATKFFAS